MNKDAPVTQEMARVLGVLRQEPEAKTKYTSFIPQRISKNLTLKCSSGIFLNYV